MLATETAVAEAKLNAAAAITCITHGKHISETTRGIACRKKSRSEQFPFFRVVMDITITQQRKLLLKLAAAASAAATNAGSHFSVGSVAVLWPWLVMRARPAAIAVEIA